MDVTARDSDDPAGAPPRRDDDARSDATPGGNSGTPPNADGERTDWAHERRILVDMLAQQQRVAQAGLITSSLAHDIRNQAQMILATAELSLVTDGEEGLRRALREIMAYCHDVAETTEAFMAFARRRSMAEHQTFAVSDVLEHTERLIAPLARNHRVDFSCTVAEDGFVHGEQRMAIQAVVNLATNAIKACSEQAGGEVSITGSRPLDATCRITVADTGPGVPEQIRDRLFRPLVGSDERTGGHGLGLFIVRQAVLELNGRITVKTSPLGSIFRLDLPAVDAANRPTGTVTGPVSTPILEPLSESQESEDDAP